MKFLNFHIPTIAILIAIPSLACAKNDEKPHQAIGVWQSKDKGSFFEVNEDGTFNGHGWQRMAVGKWRPGDDNENIRIKLRVYSDKLAENMKASLVAQDQLSITIEGKPVVYTRLANKTDPKKFVGSWKNTNRFGKDKNLVTHSIVTRTDDGKAVTKTMTISEAQKCYSLNEMAYDWRNPGEYLVDTYEVEDDVTGEIFYDPVPYRVTRIDDKQITLVWDHPSDKGPVQWLRVKEAEAKFPEPPAGYKKVSEDELWESITEFDDDDEDEFSETIHFIEEDEEDDE